VCVCVFVHELSACRSWKKTLACLELGLQVIVSCLTSLQEIEPGSFQRAVCALSHQASDLYIVTAHIDWQVCENWSCVCSPVYVHLCVLTCVGSPVCSPVCAHLCMLSICSPVCVCSPVYAHVCAHLCVCVLTCVCAHLCVLTCVCSPVYAHLCVLTCVCSCVCSAVCVHLYVLTCMCAHLCMLMCMLMCVLSCVCSAVFYFYFFM
jgi:hypothetical protein